jgi:hypothetical protein
VFLKKSGTSNLKISEREIFIEIRGVEKNKKFTFIPSFKLMSINNPAHYNFQMSNKNCSNKQTQII